MKPKILSRNLEEKLIIYKILSKVWKVAHGWMSIVKKIYKWLT